MNIELVKLVKDWRSEGSIDQRGFDWSSSLENWKEAFPDEALFIANLKPAIDRTEVQRIFQDGESTNRERFLAVMIWGYEDRGYGPYRVGQMLGTANSGEVIDEVSRLCQEGKPLEGYKYLGANRLKQLGPAFGTKFLNFCTPRSIGAPIYDSLVARWVSQFASEDFKGFSTYLVNWNLRTYTRYFEWIRDHAKALDCFPDEIEHVLFEDARKRYSLTKS